MPVLGIGVDVVHLPRIRALLSRRPAEQFARRILSHEEFIHWTRLPPAAHCQYLAVRFSVKEAAYKAVSSVVRPTWKDFTYVSRGGQPSLSFHPHLVADGRKVGRMHVSASHDGEYVFTTVIAEQPDHPNLPP